MLAAAQLKRAIPTLRKHQEMVATPSPTRTPKLVSALATTSKLQIKLERLTFWSSFRPVRLHGNVRIQMVERAVRLLATVPSTLVHPLDLFVSPSWPLVLLRARYRDE